MPTRMRGPRVDGPTHPLLREGGALLADAFTSALVGPPPPPPPPPGPPPPPPRREWEGGPPPPPPGDFYDEGPGRRRGW